MTHPGQGPGGSADTATTLVEVVSRLALPDHTGRVAMRHSHHPEGLALVVGRPTWAAFVGGVKNDELAP
jgi:Domain of unknown function (DUF397)